MSETTIKMCGFALMAVSVFAILFGLYADGRVEGVPGAIVAWGGVIAFVVGVVLYAVIGKRR